MALTSSLPEFDESFKVSLRVLSSYQNILIGQEVAKAMKSDDFSASSQMLNRKTIDAYLAGTKVLSTLASPASSDVLKAFDDQFLLKAKQVYLNAGTAAKDALRIVGISELGREITSMASAVSADLPKFLTRFPDTSGFSPVPTTPGRPIDTSGSGFVPVEVFTQEAIQAAEALLPDVESSLEGAKNDFIQQLISRFGPNPSPDQFPPNFFWFEWRRQRDRIQWLN